MRQATRMGTFAGMTAGLALLDGLSGGGLGENHLHYATRADLLAQLGRGQEAALAYRRALDLAGTAAERRFLGRRLALVTGRPALR